VFVIDFLGEQLPMSSASSSTAPYYGNVQFIGVARIAGTGIIVASHAYHTKTDLNGVRQVLEQPNMNMAPGKHYSFNSGDLAWHLIAGCHSFSPLLLLICGSLLDLCQMMLD
jgi:hypothetical protein